MHQKQKNEDRLAKAKLKYSKCLNTFLQFCVFKIVTCKYRLQYLHTDFTMHHAVQDNEFNVMFINYISSA